MRTREEISRVLALGDTGLGASEIARAAGIPRGTVRDWMAGRLPSPPDPEEPVRTDLPRGQYSHLLGLYLGDGHLARQRESHVLRIFCDARYPRLIGEVVRTVHAVAPARRVTAFRRTTSNCVVVQCHWRLWPQVLPQHGPGRKHERHIELEGWQRRITYTCPRELVRGLLQSDGSRFTNIVRHGGRSYAYGRYYFTNRSEDIKAILCEHLDVLGIAWRRVGDRHISIARREAVAALDAFVGPKA